MMDLIQYAINKKKTGSSEPSKIKLIDCSYLFYKGARIELIDQFDTSESTSFNSAFMYFPSNLEVPEIDTHNGTDFSHMFAQAAIKNLPLIDTSKGTSFVGMFQGCTNLKEIPQLDVGQGEEFSGMFKASAIQTIPTLNSGNGTRFDTMFSNCYSLVTISGLDLNKNEYGKSMFSNCSSLENVYLYNIRTSVPIGSGTSYGHKLTLDSLIHTIKELCVVSSKQTLTIGTANLEKIAGLYCRILDDTDEKKPMELCESTDEGAMTLNEYALLKNWSIA